VGRGPHCSLSPTVSSEVNHHMYLVPQGADTLIVRWLSQTCNLALMTSDFSDSALLYSSDSSSSHHLVVQLKMETRAASMCHIYFAIRGNGRSLIKHFCCVRICAYPCVCHCCCCQMSRATCTL